jgi:LPS-assembly protein
LFNYRHLTPSLLLALAFSPANAQQRLQCASPQMGQLSGEFLFAQDSSADEEVVEFEAGRIEAQAGPSPSALMTGGVLVRRGARLAGADTAEYDPDTQSLNLDGNVRYADPQTEIVSDSANFSYSDGIVRFSGAEFLLGDTGSRGAASMLEINQEGILRLNSVSYTTCPPGSDDWLIEAGDIELDTSSGIGTARKVKLRFQGVPIFYAPYFSFPLGDARKSGFLAPVIGSAGRSGNQFAIPWYWNIAPNYDATITPRYLTNRGMQINSEFRYLTRRNNGIAFVEYLPDDSLIDSNRYLLSLQHDTLFDSGWRNQVDYREVSDSQYFEDLGFTLNLSSTTHLNRSVVFDYLGENWSVFGRVQDYQTIDESIAAEDRPYRRLPQLRANGAWPDQLLGMTYGVDSELVYFERDVGVTGWRFDVAPEVELPLGDGGWFVTPGVALEYTRYGLSNTEPEQLTDPSRTLPIASLDLGMLFERRMKSNSARIQTLEPRILYVHVPFREQTNLPVFDTIQPDLNLVQLYRKNRFVGVDRIGDTNQVSLGITRRILDTGSGKELVTATIGQALYLTDQQVTLPGESAEIAESSDYIAEVGFLLYEHLNFDIGYRWSPDSRGTTRSEARFQYRPQSNKVLNLAYRFRRDSLEQGDVTWSWPLTQSWNFVGRYNFSFRDQEALEQFFGLEYESCCWGFRMISRRFLSTRDGTRDSSIGFQLVLKGMSSVGTAADSLLEDSIRGYSSGIY